MKLSNRLSDLFLTYLALNNINIASSLRIELDETDAARWDDRQIKQIPKPVLGAFADHLHTIASLFSSLIGTGAYKDPTEDALDCEHTSHGHGPYCMISYDPSVACYTEFGCEFYDANINFGNDARLCCFKDFENKEFESTFISQFDPDMPMRLFQSNQNNVGHSYSLSSEQNSPKIEVMAGHFGLAELIYTPYPKAATTSTIIETWTGCPFDDAVGYHSIDILPEDSDEYNFKEMDNDFIRNYFSMCTVEGNGTQVEVHNEDVRTLMPYCTFKLLGQDCPAEAPLSMNFDGVSHGHSLPNDNMFSALTYVDSSSFCCAKSTHDTRETTVIDIDYLKDSDEANIYDFFKSRYQVLKWPHADCAEFKFPKFDIMVNTVKLSDKQSYPWAFGDMDLTFCTYTRPLTLDQIFSPTSSFDQTLSEIDISEDKDTDVLTRPCEEDDDCYVPPAETTVMPSIEVFRETFTTLGGPLVDHSGNELPDLVLGAGHVPEYDNSDMDFKEVN